MVCFHKRYVLGDEGHELRHEDFSGWGELEAYLWKELDAAVVLPLYLYDHSGITMNTRGFSCPWDSGRVGIIYATRKDVRENYGVKRCTEAVLARARELLEAEVKEYDRYLTGEIYGFRIEDPDGEDVDSCWGYYDEPSKIIEEAKGIIDHVVAEAIKESNKALAGALGINLPDENKHYPKVEVFVTKGWEFRARIRETVTEPTYEVTIGGEQWGKGKGNLHEGKIRDLIEIGVGGLLSKYEEAFGEN
jgi:hypothetical protein